MRLLPLRIALRYLVSKKSHTAVSVISTIAVCAVAVTALAMICVLSVFNGFHQLVDSKMSSMEPAVKVSAKRGVIVDASRYRRLKALKSPCRRLLRAHS